MMWSSKYGQVDVVMWLAATFSRRRRGAGDGEGDVIRKPPTVMCV